MLRQNLVQGCVKTWSKYVAQQNWTKFWRKKRFFFFSLFFLLVFLKKTHFSCRKKRIFEKQKKKKQRKLGPSFDSKKGDFWTKFWRYNMHIYIYIYLSLSCFFFLFLSLSLSLYLSLSLSLSRSLSLSLFLSLSISFFLSFFLSFSLSLSLSLSLCLCLCQIPSPMSWAHDQPLCLLGAPWRMIQIEIFMKQMLALLHMGLPTFSGISKPMVYQTVQTYGLHAGGLTRNWWRRTRKWQNSRWSFKEAVNKAQGKGAPWKGGFEAFCSTHPPYLKSWSFNFSILIWGIQQSILRI